MDDYYVYYELRERDPLCGDIKAISPSVRPEMENMDFIRVSSEVGVSFVTGTMMLYQYVVEWDSDNQQMQLKEQESLVSNQPINFLREIPIIQDKTRMVVTWKFDSKVFNVTTTGVSESYPNMKIHFFVTRAQDQSILYHSFQTLLHNTTSHAGMDFPCDVELPEVFSVYAKHELDQYELRIMK